MTAVIFKFQKPDGAPVVGAPFTVALNKPSFDEANDDGILLPGTVEGITDASGMCTLELAPGYGMYYLTLTPEDAVANSEGCLPGLRYKFVVPESVTPVRVETLIVTTPTFSRPWDEVALAKITQAVTDSQNSALAADASADRAEQVSLSVAGDAESARQSAADALVSKNAAAGSATAAAGSASAANTSKNAAATSAGAALTSQNAAKTSENNAAASASTAATAGATAGTTAANAVVANKQDKHVNLTALAGLTGAADRFPYFTGVGALSLATITAIGRQLIGGADAAAMRNTLGALATSDVSALIKATGWGLELADQATTLADCNLALVTGIYRSNTSVLNKPVSAGGLLEVKKGFAATLFQIFYATDQTVWWRFTTVSGTNWSVWASFVKSTDLGTAAALTATTSTSDTTDGRAARIGDHGLGSQVSPFISDMEAPLANGYSWVTSGTANPILGFASGSQVLTFFASVNEIAQLYFSRTTPMRIGTRRKTAGAWQSGTDVVTTAGAILDPSLNTGGILSTSIVSGFRVDKYINGTMCVTGKVSLPSIAANVYPYQTLTLPVTFFNTANMVPMLTCNASTSADSYGVVFQRAASTTSVLYAIRNGATAQTFEVNVCVWGTWK